LAIAPRKREARGRRVKSFVTTFGSEQIFVFANLEQVMKLEREREIAVPWGYTSK
jgi:hypothetical protein